MRIYFSVLVVTVLVLVVTVPSCKTIKPVPLEDCDLVDEYEANFVELYVRNKKGLRQFEKELHKAEQRLLNCPEWEEAHIRIKSMLETKKTAAGL